MYVKDLLMPWELRLKLVLFFKGSKFSISFPCTNLNNMAEEEKKGPDLQRDEEISIHDSLIMSKGFSSFNNNDPLISENRFLDKEKCFPYLVVDDDPTNTLVLQEYFRSINLNCEVAYNGKEAIDLIKFHSNKKCCKGFKLILMDINMPIMD